MTRARRSKTRSQKNQPASDVNVDTDDAEVPPSDEPNPKQPRDVDKAERGDSTGGGRDSRGDPAADMSNTQEKLILSADVVFQCGTCRTVLGDTLSEYEAHLESNSISLRAARNVVIKGKMEMADTGYDAGCTFKAIQCAYCESIIGRVYSSTTPALDNRRSTFTFDTRSLISYQLGSCRTLGGEVPITPEGTGSKNSPDHRSGVGSLARSSVSQDALEALDVHVRSLVDANAQNELALTELKEAERLNTHSVAELRSNMQQAQNMILLWEERFQRLAVCEQRLDELSSVQNRVTSLEGRRPGIETPAKSVSFSPADRPGVPQPTRQVGSAASQLVHRPPSRLKASPSIRRPVQSPARTAARRAAPSPVGTPLAKRLRQSPSERYRVNNS